MRVLANFIVILGQVLNLAILARILISWLPVSRDSAIVNLLYEITEPILGPLRRVIPPLGGLDFSPMVALVLIQVAQSVLLRLLSGLA